MLAFQLEGKIVGQMTAFMVASKQPEGIGIPNFERPQVQDALLSEISAF